MCRAEQGPRADMGHTALPTTLQGRPGLSRRVREVPKKRGPFFFLHSSAWDSSNIPLEQHMPVHQLCPEPTDQKGCPQLRTPWRKGHPGWGGGGIRGHKCSVRQATGLEAATGLGA